MRQRSAASPQGLSARHALRDKRGHGYPRPAFSDPAAWAALLTLIVLEVVLGIDNLVFIAILSNKLPRTSRRRRVGSA